LLFIDIVFLILQRLIAQKAKKATASSSYFLKCLAVAFIAFLIGRAVTVHCFLFVKTVELQLERKKTMHCGEFLF
jgi:hypothetical protein